MLFDCGAVSILACSMVSGVVVVVVDSEASVAIGDSGVVGTSGVGGVGRSGSVGIGILSSGMFMDWSGAIGSGAGGTISTLASGIGGTGKGPTGSLSSPVSPSGMEDGAATGSEKTGSELVVFVMSSIAYCRLSSTV